MVESFFQRFWPAWVLGLSCVIAGGLLSAVTAHAATQAASWASAYLVLVGGVATSGLAAGRGLLSREAPTPARLGIELGLWVAGNALVLIGTLLSPAWFVEAGSVLLVLALASIASGVHKGTGPALVRRLFLALVIVLLVSIPVGIALSHLRR